MAIWSDSCRVDESTLNDRLNSQPASGCRAVTKPTTAEFRDLVTAQATAARRRFGISSGLRAVPGPVDIVGDERPFSDVAGGTRRGAAQCIDWHGAREARATLRAAAVAAVPL
jgi:hypothetical protein